MTSRPWILPHEPVRLRWAGRGYSWVNADEWAGYTRGGERSSCRQVMCDLVTASFNDDALHVRLANDQLVIVKPRRAS